MASRSCVAGCGGWLVSHGQLVQGRVSAGPWRAAAAAGVASGAKAGKARCGYLSFLLGPFPSHPLRSERGPCSSSLCLCISKHGPEWAPTVGLSLTVCHSGA